MKYLLLISNLLYVVYAIRWNKTSQQTSQPTRFVLGYQGQDIIIDVAFEQQVTIVRDGKIFAQDIIISCNISAWQDTSVIKYSFCKESDCEDILDNVAAQDIKKFNLKGTYVSQFDGQKGLVVRMRLIDDLGKIDFSGNYQCKVEDKQTSSIQSNYIQIRDTYFWARNLFMLTSTAENMTVPEISSQNVPIILSCKNDGTQLNNQRPDWTKEEFNSPLKWSACPVILNANKAVDQMSKDRCKTYTTQKCDGSINPAICPQPVSEFNTEWKTYQTTDGDLIIFSVPKAQPLYTVMFMCYVDLVSSAIPIMYYYVKPSGDNLHIVSGIQIKAESTGISVPLTIMNPTVQNVNVYARKVTENEKMTEIYIYTLYKGWPVTIGAWQKNGIAIIKNDYLAFDKNVVVLSKEIRLDVAGNYTMAVTQGSTTVQMTVNLNVLSPPATNPTDCPMLSIYYVDAGKSVTILCNYTGSNLASTVQVKDQMLYFDMVPTEFAKVLINRYPEFTDAAITATSTRNPDGKLSLNYSVSFPISTERPQDHTTSFMLKNTYGFSIKSATIYVVPQLKSLIRKAPEISNCTESCRSTDSHKFICDIDIGQYNNKELRIDYYWSLDNRQVNDPTYNKYAEYFQVDPQTKILTLQPVYNVSALKDKLKNNEFVCIVILTRLDNGEKIYSSLEDLTLNNMMRAKITLDFEKVTQASIYWIIAVILGIIIIIILIVLLTRYCVRQKGDTYNLDKIERQHGYDPEKEVQEEQFKPYEREDHDPEIGSGGDEGRRMSLAGHSVGSADDGELDDYGLDPSNFNEDGSIIGKYGANPRNRAVGS